MSVASFFGVQNTPNILTGGLTDQPQWNPVNLDPDTVNLINNMNQRGQASAQDVANQTMAGTSPTMPNATGGAVAQQQATLGGDADPSVTQALNDRANRMYAAQYNQLQNQALAAAPGRQGAYQNAAAQALQAQQNVNDELNRQQMAVTQQQWAMRNQVVGQLFSGAGAMFGALAAGKAGSNAGSAFAQAINGPITNTNMPSYTSDYNSPYNLTGDPTFLAPGYGLGVDTGMGTEGMAQGLNSQYGQGPIGYGYPGQDGNGYYGEPPPTNSSDPYYGNNPNLGIDYNMMPQTGNGYYLENPPSYSDSSYYYDPTQNIPYGRGLGRSYLGGG